jgi:hypothetical protein
MTPRPLAHREICIGEGFLHFLREAGLEVDEVPDGMESRTINGIPGAQVIVEDAAEHLDDGAAEPGPAGGADGED